ncbi:MAG TPA: crossover junction endodeoxyribonuclease RuvC [Patescibacteria group bacterium]|nr:crossover junction endodeoxyribonuclease RuvC [Patescibacteria group bacterium]
MNPVIKILGIDPGIGRCGFAVLEQDKKNIRLLEAGCIVTKSGNPEPARLLEIQTDLQIIIQKWKPQTMAVESLFFISNQKTAISVAQARGAVLVTAAAAGLKILDITPLQVKMSVTGYGKADKKQIQTMIVKLLNLKKLPKPDDAADAVAVAWAGIGRSGRNF